MMTLRWPTTPTAPTLEPGEVHVWSWSLDADAAPLRASLSADEQARADRFLFERDRVRFTVAHARMRALLGRYVPDTPLVFRTGSHGKPELDFDTDVRFNLSHSRELALLAVTRGFELGVDVEFLRPISEKIADRFFAPEESAALRALPAEEHEPAFYRCWTRKEAVLKGVGTGLSGGLASFVVPVTGTARFSVPSLGWELEHLEPAEGYVGALAVKGRGWVVRCFGGSLTGSDARRGLRTP